jgi:hypothetical protein
VIIEPDDGATVRGDEVVIRGLAPPGARVVHDIPLAPDPSTTADVDGRWVMRVRLEPGANQLTFRVGDDVGTARTLLVNRR